MQPIRLYFSPILLAISFSLANPCTPPPVEKPTTGDGPEILEAPIPVSTVMPKFVESPRQVRGKGKFAVTETLVLKAPLSGVIEKILVNEGDGVKVGDSLIQIKGDDLNRQIEQKQAELKEAEAQLDLDKKNLDLNTNRPETDNGNPAFLDEDDEEDRGDDYRSNDPAPKPAAPNRGIDWEAKVKVSEARVERITTELTHLEERIKMLLVTTPFGGIVRKKQVVEGSTVVENDELMEVIGMDPITLIIGVPQDVASYVDKSTPVKVNPLGAADLVMDGTVYYISPQIDPATHNLELRIHIPNPNGTLKDGQDGEAVVFTRKVEKVLVIPKSALMREGERHFIYVVQGRKAYLTDVIPGQEVGAGEIEIDANLRVDDPIIVEPPMELRDGGLVAVQVVPSPSAVSTPMSAPLPPEAAAPVVPGVPP